MSAARREDSRDGTEGRAADVFQPELTAEKMVTDVRALAQAGNTSGGDRLSGPGCSHKPIKRAPQLGQGLGRFDFERPSDVRCKIINDAAMQALGGYHGGRMLFLGLGTGLGSTLIVDGVVVPMELGHLPYKKATYEDYVGSRAPRARRQEEVAQIRRRRDRADGRRAGARRRGARRRKRQRSWRSCRRAADSATTPTRSSEGFACGSGRSVEGTARRTDAAKRKGR